MSNNKQIKLYTEEQVRIAINKFKFSRYVFQYEKNEVINSLTHIELPSDKEIEDESGKYYDNNALKAHDYYFELGAKWMRDLIQGGNK